MLNNKTPQVTARHIIAVTGILGLFYFAVSSFVLFITGGGHGRIEELMDFLLSSIVLGYIFQD